LAFASFAAFLQSIGISIPADQLVISPQRSRSLFRQMDRAVPLPGQLGNDLPFSSYVRNRTNELSKKPRWRVALFVNGCFWHSHANCPRARIPKSNAQYWIPKLIRNKRRDADNARALRKLGWRCVRIWECETKDPNRLAGIVRRKIIARTPGGN
jgi:DNA mismatch endonuclease (patch repair protein)